MARRQKNSPIEDLVELVSMMPWWVGCLLGVVSYFWLHSIAAPSEPVRLVPGQVATAVSNAIWMSVASIGQYVVPMACLIGAVVSALNRQKRAGLIESVASSKTADVLDGVSWQEFELLVGEAFRLQGYQVTETGGGGADGGIDLVLRRGGEKFLVQCKQWKAFTVGVTVVRELYGVMAAGGAAGGFVVTSGQFTNEAKEFASGRNVSLVDGTQLFEMIRKAKSARLDSVAVKPLDAVKFAPTPVIDSEPLCPVCRKPMVQRTARSGRSAGSAFWGCSGYPACRGTRQIN